MLWVFLALMATFVWAWAIILDKVLRIRYLKHSISLSASFGIFGMVFAIFLFPFVGIPLLPLKYFLAAFIAGIIAAFSLVLYIKALSREEASRVVPLWHLSALFTLILAVIFLNEILTPLSYVAFAFILVGGILISTRRIGKVFHLSPAVGLMLFSSLLAAISDVLMKFAYSTGIFWKTFFILYLGIVLTKLSFFVLPSIRKQFLDVVVSKTRIFMPILFLSALSGIVGYVLYNNALLRGPVTLVSVFISFSSLFVLLIATFLSLKFPLFIKEAYRCQNNKPKINCYSFDGFRFVFAVIIIFRTVNFINYI